MNTCYFCLIILTSFLLGCKSESPVVQTPLGVVTGYTKTSHYGRIYSVFEGIPFAKPPIGGRRFEKPEAIEPWLGTWNATQTITCAQNSIIPGMNSEGEEDCLYINVYVPREKINPQENLEVVVEIHGGAYMHCSGHFYSNPKFIMDSEFIFVSFNYRLGIFGYLSTEDDVVPGNMGMKDQVLALQWIQDNIASFGGNPKSVTITGLSAGGASVHLHYLSKMSRGLFHRGISHSGAALNPWSLQEKALDRTKIIAEALGCPTSSTKILVECLKQKPTEHVLDKVRLLYFATFVPIAPFAPVVENTPDGFLTADPYYLLKKGEVYDVPWIVSRATHEGIPFIGISEKDLESHDKNWENIAPHYLDFTDVLDESLWSSVSNKIRKFYFGDEKISLDNVDNLVAAVGDRMFAVSIDQSAKMQAKVTKSPVYFYHFGYPGESSKSKYAPHGVDGQFWYGFDFIDPSRKFTENELGLTDLLYKMLYSFTKTGIPEIEGITWKPVGKDNKLTYLNITSYNIEGMTLETRENISPEDFWTSLGLSEGENLLHSKDEL